MGMDIADGKDRNKVMTETTMRTISYGQYTNISALHDNAKK